MSDSTVSRGAGSTIARGTFARLVAAGAAGGVAIGIPSLASAQDQTGFGKPHAPVVAENDPAIRVDRTAINYLDETSNTQRKLNAYAAYPRQMTAKTPGVVVIQAIWGVDSQLRDTVRRFAREGYMAIAPDLYTGLTTISGDGATDYSPFRDVAAKLSDQQVDRDLRAAATTLRVKAAKLRRGGSNDPKLLAQKIAAVGFCMGGSIALRQAIDNGDVFQAVAVFYGKVRYGTTGNNGTVTPIALTYANDIVAPFLGSFGEKDTSIVADDVRALDGRLTQINKPHDIKVYAEAGHAFFDDTRDSYVASAATDAWARTLAWFHSNVS